MHINDHQKQAKGFKHYMLLKNTHLFWSKHPLIYSYQPPHNIRSYQSFSLNWISILVTVSLDILQLESFLFPSQFPLQAIVPERSKRYNHSQMPLLASLCISLYREQPPRNPLSITRIRADQYSR